MNCNPDEPATAHGDRESDALKAKTTKSEDAEKAARAERFATICKLNPGGMTGDARKINKQKLAFEGQ